MGPSYEIQPQREFNAESMNYHYLTLLLGSEDFVFVPVSSEVAKSQLERLPENLYKRNE